MATPEVQLKIDAANKSLQEARDGLSKARTELEENAKSYKSPSELYETEAHTVKNYEHLYYDTVGHTIAGTPVPAEDINYPITLQAGFEWVNKTRAHTQKDPTRDRPQLLALEEINNKAKEFYNASNEALTERFDKIKAMHGKIVDLQKNMSDPGFKLLDETTQNSAMNDLKASLAEYEAATKSYKADLDNFTTIMDQITDAKDTIPGRFTAITKPLTKAFSGLRDYMFNASTDPRANEQNQSYRELVERKELPAIPPDASWDPRTWSVYSTQKALSEAAKKRLKEKENRAPEVPLAAPIDPTWAESTMYNLRRVGRAASAAATSVADKAAEVAATLTPSEEFLLESKNETSFRTKYLTGVTVTCIGGDTVITSAPLGGILGGRTEQVLTAFTESVINHGLANVTSDSITIKIVSMPTDAKTHNEAVAYFQALKKAYEAANPNETLTFEGVKKASSNPLEAPKNIMEYDKTLSTENLQFGYDSRFGPKPDEHIIDCGNKYDKYFNDHPEELERISNAANQQRASKGTGQTIGQVHTLRK